MIEFAEAARREFARTTFWTRFWFGVVIVLFLFIAYVGFFLAEGTTGCLALGKMLALYCGSHTGMAFAACLFVSPIAFYVAVKRPWVVVALYALFVPSDSYLNFTSFGSLTKISAILAIGVIILHQSQTRKFANPGPAVVVWLTYLTWSSLTLFWAFNNVNDNTLQLWGTLWQLAVFYLLLVVTPIDEKHFRMVLFCFIIGSMAASVFGAYTFGVGGQKILNQGRLKAHFNPDNAIASDIFAASLVFPIGIVVMNALRSRWGLVKIGSIVAFGILMVGQFVVGSRGAILADLVMMTYYFFKSRYKGQLLFVAASGLIFSLMYPSAIWARILAPDTSGGSGRIPIWKVGVAALKHYWLLGAGFSNFPYVYNKYFLTVFSTFDPKWHRAPHNIVLEAWVELGIFGLSIMLLGWWTTFKSVDNVPKTSEMYDFRIALEGALIGAFFAALFVGIMLMKFTWWQYTIFALWRQVTTRKLAEERALPPPGVTLETPEIAGGPAPPPTVLQPQLGRAR